MGKLLAFTISCVILSIATKIGAPPGRAWIPMSFGPAIAAAQEPVTYLDTLIARARALLEGDPKDVELAVKLLEEATKAGSLDAMVALAQLYSKGKGVPKDGRIAKELLLKVIAGGGSGNAYVVLGDLYRDASGSEYDTQAAVSAYRKAIEFGNTEAMITLGRMFASGDGVATDFEAAKALFERAISAGGERDGWASLGTLYRDSASPHRDLAKAADALQRAADLGDPWSMMILARMSASGEGVAQDFDRAKDLFQSAIEVGAQRDGWAGLATLYLEADAPHRDEAKGIDALQHAAKFGDPWSMIILARRLGEGDGLPADFDRAKTLLEAASTAGQQTAASESLGDLFWRGNVDRRDPATALHYYKIAADAGSGAANLAAGEIESADFANDDQRLSMVRHFKKAAQILGPAEVAKAMFNLSPLALTAAVKQMLLEAGQSPGLPNGVFDDQTQSAIGSFCTAKNLAPCDNVIITLALLTALLQA